MAKRNGKSCCGMKARRVRDLPCFNEGFVARTLVAYWWPGRYHLVSTIMGLGTTAPLAEFAGTPARRAWQFTTQIFVCNRRGFPTDYLNPLHGESYSTREEAQAGHKRVLEEFLAGRIGTSATADK